MLDLEQHLKRQIAFSRATFGPGPKTTGIIDHITKELWEVSESHGSPQEWVDIVILGLDGLTRAIMAQEGCTTDATAARACAEIVHKQGKNEGRVWPDWRSADPNKAIEHVRGDEE